ncbi:hypothetical protein [Massilia endophytica]|uniref:hypothetical protein n=1 Tax=Massilia endophytica TaxID=2899220 RepID=UPI001E593062|nr:hypothetical protein [Massilia endophytica]UGQ48935.1 hypothetical protein LSQ66_10860 [Massilia endophytica]
MCNYSKVQFISWELHTGPFILSAPPGQLGSYSGLLSPTPGKRADAFAQCWDIEARLAFTADAIERAEAMCDPSVKTLKVFMAPAFTYRGAGGAYLHGLLEGWSGEAPSELQLPPPYHQHWDGLFGGLRSLVASVVYEDWIFVFGTAVSASFPARRDGGKHALDPTLPGELWSSALVQRGGAMHGRHHYLSRKHYRSGAAFLRWYGAAGQPVLSALPEGVIGVDESSALCRIPTVRDHGGVPIDFGVEVGLDHARSGDKGANRHGRVRTAGRFVKIQLVPSCGMVLLPESVRLQPANGPTTFSYAFNCDGLTAFSGEAGSHTQLWNGVYGGLANRLVEASGGEPYPGTRTDTVAAQLLTSQGPVSSNMLWNNGNGLQGAGTVRVVNPLEL